MKCDQCDKEAIVHETVVRAGSLVERHLCETHAMEAGFDVGQQHVAAHEIFKLALSAAASAKQVLACRRCGMSYSEFQSTGLLGCGGCYEAFAGPLGALIERAHEGAMHHVGKTPRRAAESAGTGAPPLSATDRMRVLRTRLEQAVHQEDYEQAARLRDELSDMSSPDVSRGEEQR